MPALRKAAAYSKKRARPYTRMSRKRSKAYIKVKPNNKIVKYDSGNRKSFDEGKHTHIVKLISKEKKNIQIRDNALEATRTLVNKKLEKAAPGQFFLKIKVHPHHILRENKTAAGAGADRLSSGMKHSFGIIIGRAAIVRPEQEILFISCANERIARMAKNTLAMIKPKMPGKVKISFEKLE